MRRMVMMRYSVILHLLDFFELCYVFKTTLQCSVEVRTRIRLEIEFIYLADAFVAHQRSGKFNIAQMFIDQIEQGIDPRRDGYCASAHGKIDIGGTTLRRNQLLATAFIPCVGAKWMVTVADHALIVFFLCSAAHTAPRIAFGASDVHVSQR